MSRLPKGKGTSLIAPSLNRSGWLGKVPTASDDRASFPYWNLQSFASRPGSVLSSRKHPKRLAAPTEACPRFPV